MNTRTQPAKGVAALLNLKPETAALLELPPAAVKCEPALHALVKKQSALFARARTLCDQLDEEISIAKKFGDAFDALSDIATVARALRQQWADAEKNVALILNEIDAEADAA